MSLRGILYGKILHKFLLNDNSPGNRTAANEQVLIMLPAAGGKSGKAGFMLINVFYRYLSLIIYPSLSLVGHLGISQAKWSV